MDLRISAARQLTRNFDRASGDAANATMDANSTAMLSITSTSGSGARATGAPLIEPAALYRRQVQEAYASLQLSASISLFAAILALMALGNTGDLKAGIYWFGYACAVFVFRFAAASRFHSFKRGDATFPNS